MAENSDGNTDLTTIVTCEGDLLDPRFPAQLDIVVDRLSGILGDEVKVRKLEPWNSVRVTLSIPREAALRLRQLANEGSQQLRALGILSVQVEGDQVISLRIATGSVNSEPQEIILRTAQDGSSNDRHHETDLGLSTFLSTNNTTSSATNTNTNNNNNNNTQVQFKSPNVVCPADSVVPKVGAGTPAPSNASGGGGSKGFTGPFPFASMNQAIHSNSNREAAGAAPFNSLPPPYPSKHPPVTLSSPLLVNLLQNDGVKESGKAPGQAGSRQIRTPPVSVQKTTVTVSAAAAQTISKPNYPAQANVLANSSVSPPSALSTNTSIRQNSTILTSTTGSVDKTPPPQYHRALPASLGVKQSVGGFHSVSNAASSSTSSNSLSQNTLLSHHHTSSHLPHQANNPTTPQTSLPLQIPNNAFQSQTQSRNHPTLTNSLPMPNSTLPQPAMTQAKPPLSLNKHSLAGMPVKNLLTQPMVSAPQQKLKTPPPPQTAPIVAKNPTHFMPQPMKIPPTLTSPAVVSPQVSISSSLPPTVSKGLPSPPPYSVAISRPWDSLVHAGSLMDLPPSLTDLKADDLDDLLPSFELSHSPLRDLPEDFLSVHSNLMGGLPGSAVAAPVEDKRKFLINPLTGELEPQSSSESDTEDVKDVFTGLPSPAAFSDEDTNSTTRPDTTTDQSDSETRSSDTAAAKPPRLKTAAKARERGRDSPAALNKPEKIKLRLKLEKSEPINPAYKVDVSFINTQPRKASTSLIAAGEELRVPPLHISLRGRNSVVIKNKNKLNPDGTPAKPKARKSQEHGKAKKSDCGAGVNNSEDVAGNVGSPGVGEMAADQLKAKLNSMEQKKFKKFKAAHDHKDIIASLSQEGGDLKSKFVIHNHYKDKQKERRGSDSDLVRNNKKYLDSNGSICGSDEKKRRLSQSEQADDQLAAVLGSTNVGTIVGMPQQKPRKDKVKVKEVFKKEGGGGGGRCKVFSKSLVQSKQVQLPTAGEMNMEAKFKQGLLEGAGDKGVARPPHRTELVNRLVEECDRMENAEKATAKTMADDDNNAAAASPKDKSPEPDKCNTPDRKSSVVDLGDKPTGGGAPPPGGRSPNSGAGQGEDSGIESMDALSEKSPNQASQSPHADLLPPKTQVPNMLDIEAQLAKMEGLNGDSDRGGGDTEISGPTEDVNENKCHQDQTKVKLKQCCELTCALQDSLKQGTLGTVLSTPKAIAAAPSLPLQQPEVSLVPLKVKKEEDLEPLPVRVTPPLFTYSNPEKARGGSESPAALSDDDSNNSCSTGGSNIMQQHGKHQGKSLLEQLLIEIPNDHQGVPSSPSPATRSSVRTRALSKLNSPELNSPVPKNTRGAPPPPPTKRKRNESDSSSHSLEEGRKKSRKAAPEAPAEAVKTRQGEPNKVNNVKKGIVVAKVQNEESSDSDEPLIEKLRKQPASVTVPGAKGKVKSVHPTVAANNNKAAAVMNTRRSVRSNMPAQNTRSKGDKIQSESEALRRKTRSAVSDVENKRKKEVK